MHFICREDGKQFTAHIDDTAPPPTHVVVPGAPPRTRSTGDASAPDAPDRAPPAAADALPAALPALATGPGGDPAGQRVDL
jgi:hypothetical protein